MDLPAGRYQTLLSPSAMADLFIYLYWSTGAKDALDGRTVFSKPGGGTRVGERLASLPVTLRSDPGAAGLRCAPFVIARTSGRDASVFDNGLAIPPGHLAGQRRAQRPDADQVDRRAVRAAADARNRQPDLRGCRGRREVRWTS